MSGGNFHPADSSADSKFSGWLHTSRRQVANTNPVRALFTKHRASQRASDEFELVSCHSADAEPFNVDNVEGLASERAEAHEEWLDYAIENESDPGLVCIYRQYRETGEQVLREFSNPARRLSAIVDPSAVAVTETPPAVVAPATAPATCNETLSPEDLCNPQTRKAKAIMKLQQVRQLVTKFAHQRYGSEASISSNTAKLTRSASTRTLANSSIRLRAAANCRIPRSLPLIFPDQDGWFSEDSIRLPIAAHSRPADPASEHGNPSLPAGCV